MVSQVSYDINTIDGRRHITITPVNQPLPGGDYYATGVYRLSEGAVGMGDITFDEDMNDWDYDGIGELTWEEAAVIANFIKNYKDPAGADPSQM